MDARIRGGSFKPIQVTAMIVTAVTTGMACAALFAGYGDMYALIRSMVSAKYDGSIILDHTPSFEEFAGKLQGTMVFSIRTFN